MIKVKEFWTDLRCTKKCGVTARFHHRDREGLGGEGGGTYRARQAGWVIHFGKYGVRVYCPIHAQIYGERRQQ